MILYPTLFYSILPDGDFTLRTTISMSITKQFNLKEGDHLKWEIQAKESKLLVVVSRVK